MSKFRSFEKLTHLTKKMHTSFYGSLMAVCALSLTACVEKKEETTKEVVQPAPQAVPVPGPEKIIEVPKVEPVPVPVPVPTPAPQESKKEY